MSELKELQSKIKKISKLTDDLFHEKYSFVGKKVKFSKSYIKFIKEHHKDLGTPYEEVQVTINPNTIGEIVKVNKSGINYTFFVKVEGYSQKIILTALDIVEI